MADYISEHASVARSTGVAGPARMNQVGEIVSTPWIYQLMLEGRVFTAGHGIEEAVTTGQIALDDQAPMFGLVAPATGGAVIVPLFFRAYFRVDGGTVPDWYLSYVQADKAAGAAGTALSILNCLGGSSPRSATALPQHTLTGLTAITDAQNVILTQRLNLLSALIATEAGTGKTGIELPGGRYSAYEAVWTPDFPIGLAAGGGIYFYAYTTTTGSGYNVSMAWAEVPPNYKVG